VNASGQFAATDVAMTWDAANTACAAAGARLPTIEELYTLSVATHTASGTTYTPPGFVAAAYWSSTTVPSVSGQAYYVPLSSAGIYGTVKSNSTVYVHCVR
jgi:hypothetical protein